MSRHEENENEVAMSDRYKTDRLLIDGKVPDWFKDEDFNEPPDTVLVHYERRTTDEGIDIHDLRSGPIHAGTGLRQVEIATLNPFVKDIQSYGQSLAKAFNNYKLMVSLLELAEKELRHTAPEKASIIRRTLNWLGKQ